MTHVIEIDVAGVTLSAVKTKAGYGVSVRQYEHYLGLSPKFTVNSKRGKSPEVLQEAGIHTELNVSNVRIGRSTTAFIDTKDLVKLIGVFARRGNNIAMSWLIALANETLERRIDTALGETKTEADYEQQTREFFRELSRKSFNPRFTFWLKEDQDNGSVKQRNYGILVNQLKSAAFLPKDTIDEYDAQTIERWTEALMVYNAHRTNTHSHKQALSLVRAQFYVA